MNTNAIGALTNATTASSGSSQTSHSATSQRDLFMTLLVAQLKNQDPLAPQDSTQFVAQLAQFNSLDQLINIREALDQLVAANHTTGSTNTPANSKSLSAPDLLSSVK